MSDADNVTLCVSVKPGSKHPGIETDGDTIVLRVRERAVEGAANEACIRALATALDVAPSRIALVRGAKSRRKLLRIAGLTPQQAHHRLTLLSP
ncbi:MAG TPA: DUF167 domain-containing protein [Candidatus Baltobacteraceae bacterium]|nr:DUF167 domain-containing protein [Candidatus Baltobacteraceae bacterium]